MYETWKPKDSNENVIKIYKNRRKGSMKHISLLVYTSTWLFWTLKPRPDFFVSWMCGVIVLIPCTLTKTMPPRNYWQCVNSRCWVEGGVSISLSTQRFKPYQGRRVDIEHNYEYEIRGFERSSNNVEELCAVNKLLGNWRCGQAKNGTCWWGAVEASSSSWISAKSLTP